MKSVTWRRWVVKMNRTDPLVVVLWIACFVVATVLLYIKFIGRG
jgi:hypothetical protein